MFARVGAIGPQTVLVETSVPPNGLQGWSVSISADGNTAIVGGPWTDVLRDYTNPRPFLPRRRLGLDRLGRSVKPASKTGRHKYLALCLDSLRQVNPRLLCIREQVDKTGQAVLLLAVRRDEVWHYLCAANDG
jgi:hypothetical protein